MRCSKARRMISDSLDSTLTTERSARLRKHLDVCCECREIHHDFESIARGAQELKTPLPSDQTWAAIKAKFEAAKKTELSLELKKGRWHEIFFKPMQWRYAVAALLVCFVIGGILLGIRYWPGKMIAELSEQEQFTLAKLKEAERHYQLAIKALRDALGSQEGSLEPDLAEVYARSLRDIDSIIRACEDVVSRDPNNLEARVYLISAYREKVDFLGRALDMKKTSLSRNGTEKTI